MNIHTRMRKIKIIGCMLLFGTFLCSCERFQETMLGHDTLDDKNEIAQTMQEAETSQKDAESLSGEGVLTEDKENQEMTSSNEQDISWETYPWELIPGEQTMENFLVTALSPVGQTMYIWGGGWNEEDTGAGSDATTLGLSPEWAEFAAMQTAEYDYYDYKYLIHKGLDCSGYIGWLVYNLFETENGKDGYVMKSSLMAEEFAKKGWGSFTPAKQVTDWQLGDIMSMNGHVWISLGTCADGSVLILHSSITGVIVCGTTLPDGSDSEAVELARQFMSTCYPKWYERYPQCSRPYKYLTDSGQFRWDQTVMMDQWNLKDYVVEDLMSSIQKKLLAK